MSPETFGVTPDLGAPAGWVRAAITLIFILSVLFLRYAISRIVSRPDGVLGERQRWWLSTTRNTANGFILIGIAVIWAPELGDFALSITAFAVALVIATKELILCASGAVWRGAARPFGIGDWIEVGGYFGEVIDETLLSTELQEVDRVEYRFTGRTVSVPNSLLLSAPAINHNFRKRFLMHEFTIHSEPNCDGERVRAAMETALVTAAGGFGETARRYAGVIERRTGAKLPEPVPVVHLGTNEYGKMAYRCALFCPRDKVAEMERVAMAAWLAAGGAVPVGAWPKG